MQLQLDLTSTVRLHPMWEYDIDQVKGIKCLHCGAPIGEEYYHEITTLARFGQILFVHQRCNKEAERRR